MAKIFFCGDIINQFSDKQFIGNRLREVIHSADYAVCNFEGVANNPSFPRNGMLQKESTPASLKEAGFNLCLLANNHITDYGLSGLDYTIEQLSTHGLCHTGVGHNPDEVYKAFITQIGNQTIGFINICEAQVGQFDNPECNYGYAWIGWPEIDTIFRNTKKQVDILFACVHAGLEHYELPLKEFRSLYRRYCDLGADYVIGAHPHIAQGIENYNDSTIFYSLGNFYFPRTASASYNDYENNSFSVIIDTESKRYKLVSHRLHNLEVEYVSPKDTIIDIIRLNESLGQDYRKLIRKQNDKAYNNLVYRLYQEALNGQEPDDSFLRKIKNTIKYFLKLVNYKNSKEHQQYRRKLLQRLVENETYRYLTIDVLKNQEDEEY